MRDDSDRMDGLEIEEWESLARVGAKVTIRNGFLKNRLGDNDPCR